MEYELVEVEITLVEFCNPLPEHFGERVRWRDGTLHGMPEFGVKGPVTVLRRVEKKNGPTGEAHS